MIHLNWARLAIAAASIAAAGLSQATVVDLTGSNDSGTIAGAQFVFTDQQPTGTGVIDPFLRLQATPNEEGYNTSLATPAAPFDDKAGVWTHDVRYSDLQQSTVSIGGTQYFKLLLDINEPAGSKSLISLDSLQIYTSATAAPLVTDVSNLNSLGTLRYNIDAGGDSYVLLDAARNHGSGSGDMYAYIPVSNFAGTLADDYVYLYSRFGDQQTADATSEGGFEEWAIVRNVTPVPEMSALFPIVGLLVAIASTNILRRRKMAKVLG
ncbi:MAG: hypothetical protein H0U99_00700 [Chthoniobacterales bacterium]|nr:hypothetical protein [Chthoniobacterales bacterium]